MALYVWINKVLVLVSFLAVWRPCRWDQIEPLAQTENIEFTPLQSANT